MFDLAGIPQSRWNGIKSKCAKQLNEKFRMDIKDSGFYPVWMIYEFEMLAFIAPKITGEVVGSQYIASLEKVLKNNQHNPMPRNPIFSKNRISLNLDFKF
jgi:hypothetical protein